MIDTALSPENINRTLIIFTIVVLVIALAGSAAIINYVIKHNKKMEKIVTPLDYSKSLTGELISTGDRPAMLLSDMRSMRFVLIFLVVWGIAVFAIMMTEITNYLLWTDGANWLILLILIIPLSALSAGFFPLHLRRKKLRLLKQGIRTDFTIAGLNESYRSKRGIRYFIICQGINPVTGHTCSCKSPAPFRKGIEEYLETHEIRTMPVCFDRKGAVYMMDLSSIADPESIKRLL